MSKYELIYFNGRGRAEVARLLFAENGADYTDNRLESDEWKKYKPEAPFGQLPVLKIEGKPLAQSSAIERYLAREFGLAGQCSYSVAVGESIMECMWDTFWKLPFFEKDENEKNKKIKLVMEENIRPLLAKLEARLKDNFFLDNKLSVVDIAFMHFSQQLVHFDSKIMTKYPKLLALEKRCAERPGLKKWLAERPVSQF